jgi:hypothetical protein
MRIETFRQILLALLLMPVVHAFAQDAQSIRIGERVRVKTRPDSTWIVGKVVALDADSLHVTSEERMVREGEYSRYASLVLC